MELWLNPVTCMKEYHEKEMPAVMPAAPAPLKKPVKLLKEK